MVEWRRILKNQMLVFTVSRYVGYGLQFLRGMLVAKFLGPFLLGVWGFLMLLRQYLSYTSFGLQYAVNVELATESVSESRRRQSFISAGLTGTLFITAFLVLAALCLQLLDVQLFPKYTVSRYALALAAIAGLDHLRQVLTNVYRVYGYLVRIATVELLLAIIPLGVVFLFQDEALILALLLAIVAATLLSILVFAAKAPFRLALEFDLHYLRQLVAVGIPLLVYAVSFYLITTAGRTIIGAFYPVETMGFYSLANTITSATLLGLNAVSWAVFPDILARTRAGLPDEAVLRTMQKVNDLYGTSVFLAVFGMILLLPLLFLFLPDYRPVEGTLAVLLLSQAVLSLTFGHNCVAIARKQQRRVAAISLISVAVVTAAGLLAAQLGLHFIWIAVSILLGSLVFTVLQARLGVRLLKCERAQPPTWTSMLPLGSLVAVAVLLASVLLGVTVQGGLVALAVFLLTNRPRLLTLWHFSVQKLVKVS